MYINQCCPNVVKHSGLTDNLIFKMPTLHVSVRRFSLVVEVGFVEFNQEKWPKPIPSNAKEKRLSSKINWRNTILITGRSDTRVLYSHCAKLSPWTTAPWWGWTNKYMHNCASLQLGLDVRIINWIACMNVGKN